VRVLYITEGIYELAVCRIGILHHYRTNVTPVHSFKKFSNLETADHHANLVSQSYVHE